MEYTFIISTDTDKYPNPILAISQEIEELELHNTYDRFGQKVGHDNAGDYSLHNQYSTAEIDCILEIEEKFGISNVEIGDVSEGFEVTKFDDIDCGEYESFVEGDEEYNRVLQLIIDINAFIEKWEEENADYNTVKGFNYWDGRNWQTVIVEDDTFGSPTHTIIEDDSLEKEIDSKEWVKDGFRTKVYQSENYWVINNYTQSSFASYKLYPKEEDVLEDF